MSDDRAYDLAGIELADHRALRAYRKMRDARAAFVKTKFPIYARILAQGVQPRSYPRCPAFWVSRPAGYGSRSHACQRRAVAPRPTTATLLGSLAPSMVSNSCLTSAA